MVYDGKPITIQCNSYTKPSWTYHGFVNGIIRKGIIVNKQYIFGNTLYAHKASENQHRGTYYCHGTRRSGQPFTVSSKVFVGCNYLKIII